MKTKEMARLLERNGWRFKRRRQDCDLYVKGKERENLPRQRELDEDLAGEIIRRRRLK